MSREQEWKLSRAEADSYADKLWALALSSERRAILAQEIEACSRVIRRQGEEIERLGTMVWEMATRAGERDAEIERLRAALAVALTGDVEPIRRIGHKADEGSDQ